MIIGLNGTMGSGKSTAIELLKEKFGSNNIALVKFAAPLYDMQEYVYSRISSVYKRPSDFVKDRKLLQWLGTDFGRLSIRESIWVDIWAAEARKQELNGKILVISDDVRYDNEADKVKEMGGVVVKIVADKALQRINTANGIPNHVSEVGIAPMYIDHVINNNGSLEEYRQALYGLFDNLIRK